MLCPEWLNKCQAKNIANDSQKGMRNHRNLKFFFRFLTVLLGLNLVWEIGQLPFYTLWNDGDWQQIVYAVAHCTAGDTLIAIICTMAVLAFTGWHWSMSGRPNVYFLVIFIVFGVTYTIFSEWLNTTVRMTWSYSDLMPVLPLLGTGVAPLLQWIAMPTLAFWLCSPATKTPYTSAKH